MKQRKNIVKISFWALFIPYISLIIYSIYQSFEGVVVGFFGNQTPIYGADAYSTCFFFTLLLFWYIFAACLIGQIAIILFEKIRNKARIFHYILAIILVYIPNILIVVT